jgi:hypothetical protein
MSAATAVGAAGMGMQAFGQVQSANERAQAEREDAAMRDLQARQTIKSAQRTARLLRIRGEKVKGQQIAAAASAGVELEGTPLAIVEDTAFNIAEEEAAILEGARFRAGQISAGAEARRKRAESIKRALPIQLGGTLLSGLSRNPEFMTGIGGR